MLTGILPPFGSGAGLPLESETPRRLLAAPPAAIFSAAGFIPALGVRGAGFGAPAAAPFPRPLVPPFAMHFPPDFLCITAVPASEPGDAFARATAPPPAFFSAVGFTMPRTIALSCLTSE